MQSPVLDWSSEIVLQIMMTQVLHLTGDRVVLWPSMPETQQGDGKLLAQRRK